MSENLMNSFQYVSIQDNHCCENIYAYQYNKVLSQFKASLLQGTFFRLKMKVLHRQPFLYDLNAVTSGLHLRGSSYAGIKVVPIRSIIGSESRITDFDQAFHPMNEAARERWVNIGLAYMAGLPLPAIQLIEIGNAYFIRDGHHRVSVARAFGQAAMDAEVITWKATGPFPWGPDAAHEKLFSLRRADLST
jgi:hypothetical protein